jgi:hypothetical protein
MKKVLAIVIVVVMMMALATVASAAFTEPPELKATFQYGTFPVVPAHDPELDTQAIPAGAHVYGLFDDAYAPIEIAAIAGYEKVATLGDLSAGKWTVLPVGAMFSYVILIEADESAPAAAPEEPAEEVPDEPTAPEVVEPALPIAPAPEPSAPEVIAPAPEAPAAEAPAAYKKPAELNSAFDVGKWPLAAGTYDPALDGQGIKSGTFVYGLFDANYAPVTPPTALAGYTEASSVASLGDGQYYVLIGSSGFNYVLVRPAAGAAVNTGDTGVIALVGLFALAAVAMVVVLPRKKLEK